MNTLRVSSSAYIDALTLPELQAELVLAAARLVGTRVVQSSISPQHVCRECACRATDGMQILHTEACVTGWAAHVLRVLGRREAEQVSQPHRKEPSPQENSSEPAETAVEERRPFLLPAAPAAEATCGVCGVCESWHTRTGCDTWTPVTAPLLPALYDEPWTVGDDGDIYNALGYTVVDLQGCTLAEPDDLHAMRRIAACVNHCKGVPTDELTRETERAAAGGGM